MKKIKLKLHWQILIALILAVILGYFLPQGEKYVGWTGEIFLRALKMIVIPLIFSSIISGVTNMGKAQNLRRLSLKTIIYYMSTSTIAIITGLIIINTVKPGVGADLGFEKLVENLATDTVTVKDFFTRLIPDNVVDSMSKGDILPVIFFAILFGFFISVSKPVHKKALTTFFNAFFEVMMKMTMLIIKFAPIGIFGIVYAEVAGNSENLAGIAGSLAIYTLSVITGLLFHAFITLPLILRFVGRARPFAHMKNMAAPLLTAFSTASSNATLPLTIDALENNTGVSNKISSFILPLGATINMDGTALYECMAAMFIAQVYGVDLVFSQQVLLVVIALLTSIGVAGIPMASLVMIVVVLNTMGLPMEGIGLILTVDRILDMIRTSVNVWSDTCGAVVIARSENEITNVAV